MKGYRDRVHAGDVLATALDRYRDQPGVTVLGLVRGGVPVAARVVVAVPVGALGPLALLDAVADEVVCPLVPEDFAAVSRHYRDFTEVNDEAVIAALGR